MGHVACSRKAVLTVFSEAKHHPTFMYLFGFLVFFWGPFYFICVYIYISISLYAYHIDVYIHCSPWFAMVGHGSPWLAMVRHGSPLPVATGRKRKRSILPTPGRMWVPGFLRKADIRWPWNGTRRSWTSLTMSTATRCRGTMGHM